MCKKNCIKYIYKGGIETLYVPEGFDANETKNEYFVVSSVVLRQLPETYGGRLKPTMGAWTGPLGCKVGEN